MSSLRCRSKCSSRSGGSMATCKICSGKFEIPAPVAELANPAASATNKPIPRHGIIATQAASIPHIPQPTVPATETQVWTGNPSQWVGFATYFWCVLLAIVFAVAAALVHQYFWFGLLLPLLIAFSKALRIKSTRASPYQPASQNFHRHRRSQRSRNRAVPLARSFTRAKFRPAHGQRGHRRERRPATKMPAIYLKWVNNPDGVKDQLRTYIMQARHASGTRDIDLTDTSR